MEGKSSKEESFIDRKYVRVTPTEREKKMSQ